MSSRVGKAFLLCAVIFVMACASVSRRADRGSEVPAGSRSHQETELTPSQQYAAEILSYMMQVVLGKSGGTKYRAEWTTRGIHEALDFQRITDIMSSTNDRRSGKPFRHRDISGRKSDLIVHDANILGLGEVLYSYDHALNQYKGKYVFNSVYPSTELIALRMLLARKIHQGQKIRLSSLFERRALTEDPFEPATPQDLDAVNLDAEEMKLLQDAMASEPRLRSYMKHPFLVKALVDIGVIENDGHIRATTRNATYAPYRCRHFRGATDQNALKIAFLPSITKEFQTSSESPGTDGYGFTPTPFYRRMLETLISQIAESIKSLLLETCPGFDAGGKETTRNPELIGRYLLQNRIGFYALDSRPLVIYPENAEQVVRDVCPDADLVVILLGKDVYLSMDIDPETHVYPSTNRIYLDIIDVKYGQINQELDLIGRFVLSKFKTGFDTLLK